MTDINHLPNGYELPENRMTREEWKHYFECREKYDVKYTKVEIKKFFDKIKIACNNDNLKDICDLAKKVPYLPELALQIKKTQGLPALIYANLSKAKEVYPDEF